MNILRRVFGYFHREKPVEHVKYAQGLAVEVSKRTPFSHEDNPLLKQIRPEQKEPKLPDYESISTRIVSGTVVHLPYPPAWDHPFYPSYSGMVITSGPGPTVYGNSVRDDDDAVR